MSFWDIPDAAHWNIHEIAFVNLGQFEIPQDKVWVSFSIFVMHGLIND